jgi:hypothetical protein
LKGRNIGAPLLGYPFTEFVAASLSRHFLVETPGRIIGPGVLSLSSYSNLSFAEQGVKQPVTKSPQDQ